MKHAFILFAVLSAAGSARADGSWSGSWRFQPAGAPASELRTIDHGADVEFSLELWGGPPANNSGVAQGRLVVHGGTATFETTEFGGACRIDFAFSRKRVVIKQ